MATVAEMMETQATETLAQLTGFIANEKFLLNQQLTHITREITEDGYAENLTHFVAANNSARAATYLEQDLAAARDYQEDMTDEDILEIFRKNLTQRLYIRSNAVSSSVEELKVLVRAMRFVS